MFGRSRLRLALVPLVVLLWTTFVILGGAMYVSGQVDAAGRARLLEAGFAR